MHEIVTLQLGQRSNYIATHFWNTQESYFTYAADEESRVDHDILFRPGIGADGTETFTPRTLIYDLKGGFGSLKKINALYEIGEEGGMPKGLWDGPTATQVQPAIEESPYQRSLNEGVQPPPLTADDVRYWSDFNRVFYHPRSIVQLNEYDLHSALLPFEKWSAGEDLFASLDKEHDVLDRDLRPFLEECDQLQGVQVLTGVDDAWGGFAARYMDRMRDEFGKTSIWVWASEDGRRTGKEKQRQRTVNLARAYDEIASQASLYVPLIDPPGGRVAETFLVATSAWESSAWTSMAVETMLLPPRLRARNRTRPTLGDMEATLTPDRRRRIAQLQLNGREAEQAPADAHESRAGGQSHPATACLTHFDMDLSAGMDETTTIEPRPGHTFGQVEVFRDRGEEGDPNVHQDGQPPRTRYDADAPLLTRFRTDLLFPLLDSFPSLDGGQAPLNRPAARPVRAGLSTTTQSGQRVDAIRRAVERVVGLDERESLLNGLGEIAEAYRDGWDSGSDEDDD